MTNESAAHYAKTKPVWTLRVFENLPLPQRMRAAADVLEEASRRKLIYETSVWSPVQLRGYADRWEREDADKLSREKQVEELEQIILASEFRVEALARKLLDVGWTKVTGDE